MGVWTIFKRYFIVPVTSMLSIGLTGFISWTYWTTFLPALMELEKSLLAVFLFCTFSIFPVLIYWVLIQIVCGDPGVITQKVHDKILA